MTLFSPTNATTTRNKQTKTRIEKIFKFSICFGWNSLHCSNSMSKKKKNRKYFIHFLFEIASLFVFVNDSICDSDVSLRTRARSSNKMPKIIFLYRKIQIHMDLVFILLVVINITSRQYKRNQKSHITQCPQCCVARNISVYDLSRYREIVIWLN